MTSSTKLLVAVLCVLAVAVIADIPKRYDGFTIGNPSAPVTVEMWVDLQCPDCQDALPVLQSVAQHYGDKLYFILHIFVLASHHQAFDAAQAVYAVNSLDSSKAWKMIETVFARQADFYNLAWFTHSRSELFSLLSTYAASLGVDQTAFMAQMNNGTLSSAVGASVAFGISRNVHFTPTFYVNGVFAEQCDSTWSLQQWMQFLDPLYQ